MKGYLKKKNVFLDGTRFFSETSCLLTGLLFSAVFGSMALSYE